MKDKIKIFIGCAPDGLDAESLAVLEWSIRKNTKSDVEITLMHQSKDKDSPFFGWNVKAWATPFSGFRWSIPELCDFKGKAIYMDSDMIVMADIKELWQQDVSEHVILAKGKGNSRICVSLWNCEKAKEILPSIEHQKQNGRCHANISQQMVRHIGSFDGEWNCLDREIGPRPVDDPSIKIIHYTDMRSQPQLRHAIPRLEAQGKKHWYKRGGIDLNKFPKINALFDELLEEAIENGFRPENYL